MAVKPEIVRKAYELNHAVHKNAEQYRNSRLLAISKTGLVLPDRTIFPFEIGYDIKDIFTIGAFTHSSILMTGDSDYGKTAIAKLMLNGLFGKEEQGWHRIDVDTDFGKDALTDTNFKVITEGKKISEGLYSANGFLLLQGLIADEINRTHPTLANKLMHLFDKDITLPDGKRVKLGKVYNGGKTYQFQIAAINEGSDYTGTFDIDQAMRRRTTIEIPMNLYTPTPLDRLLIQKNNTSRVLDLRNDQDRFEEVLQVHTGIENKIPMHPTAEMFLSYLESFNYCKHSMTGEKTSVTTNNGSLRHVCTAPIAIDGVATGGGMSCKFLRSFENDLCPSVRGITPGVSSSLKEVTAGFALLRATKFVEMMSGFIDGVYVRDGSYAVKNGEIWMDDKLDESLRIYTADKNKNFSKEDLAKAAVEKYISGLEIEIADITSAMKFVGFSKTKISKAYVEKFYQGNKGAALDNFVNGARIKFEEGLARPELQKILVGKISECTTDELKRIKNYCDDENPWLWRVVSPYISTARDEEPKHLTHLFGG